MALINLLDKKSFYLRIDAFYWPLKLFWKSKKSGKIPLLDLTYFISYIVSCCIYMSSKHLGRPYLSLKEICDITLGRVTE